MSKKLKLAVWKFTSCDGCQLTILDCEDDLLTLSEFLEIANFAEASSKVLKGPYDLSLVEGSITTPAEVEKIKEVRKQSRYLVAIGACATSGGIQALRNFTLVKNFSEIVYARPEYIQTLEKSTSISAHILVDFELRGCPISKKQLLETISAFLRGKKPESNDYSVCLDCKLKGNSCLLIRQKIPCLGPITRSGCDALCPSFNRGCFGCFGPLETANSEALIRDFKELGLSQEEIRRLFRSFTANPKEG